MGKKLLHLKRHTLRFRVVDRDNFDAIARGLKTVETRAASTRYQDIQKGDTLIIVCGTRRIQKKVKRVRHFTSIASMFKTIPLRRIMPSVQSISEARKVYYSYPGYKVKIQTFGLVALELGN